MLLWLSSVLTAPAPPYIPDTTTTSTTTTTPSTTTTTTTSTTTTTTTTTTPATTTIQTLKSPEFQSERIAGDERRRILQGLDHIDINHLEQLDLTPRQRLAIAQELEYQRLGLPPFTDPTPWQRLSRSQQTEFNRKYLALPRKLQVRQIFPDLRSQSSVLNVGYIPLFNFRSTAGINFSHFLRRDRSEPTTPSSRSTSTLSAGPSPGSTRGRGWRWRNSRRRIETGSSRRS